MSLVKGVEDVYLSFKRCSSKVWLESSSEVTPLGSTETCCYSVEPTSIR